jgi:gliding motility-associated protein GldC
VELKFHTEILIKMDREVVKKSTITIDVGLNKDNMPVEIKWKSSDAPPSVPMQDAKAMLISFFDRPTRDTLKMDLWTLDMQVEEMDRLVFNALRTMADTYFRATNNKELAENMQQFCQYFGEKTAIIPVK